MTSGRIPTRGTRPDVVSRVGEARSVTTTLDGVGLGLAVVVVVGLVEFGRGDRVDGVAVVEAGELLAPG